MHTNEFKLFSHKMDFEVQMNHSWVNHWLGRLAMAVVTAVLGLSLEAAQAASPPTASNSTACPALLNHTFERLQDEKPQSLCQYAGKVVLVVNTASFCGFTSQYKGLEALNTQYKDQGLVVLGFPSNDFGQQEPGKGKDIADFCFNTYGVKFPMFAKTIVKGAGRNAFYEQLAQATGAVPQWNFHKYLVARDGVQVKAYTSAVEPHNPLFIRDIERMLSTAK